MRRHLLTGVLGCGRAAGATCRGCGPCKRTIAYCCKQCRGVSIRAEHVEPLIYGSWPERLAMPDAIDLLRADHDDTEAEALRTEANALLANLEEIADERADGLLTGKQAQRATEASSGSWRQSNDRSRTRSVSGCSRHPVRSARGRRRGGAAVTRPLPRGARAC